MAKKQPVSLPTVLAAGILAWIMPGAGHVFLGRKLRGLILCACINGLFWTGVGFGGVFTVDPREQRWWAAAQMLTGASGVASWYRQDREHRSALIEAMKRAQRPDGDMTTRQAYLAVLVERRLDLVHPAENPAMAYAGIAGMLNLICIFDAALLAAMGSFGEPPPPKRRREAAA